MPSDTTLFDDRHLAAIERGLNNPTAHSVLVESLGKLQAIVDEAKRRGLVSFKCHLGRFPAFPVRMCFGDCDEHKWNVSLSFRRAYEKKSQSFFDLETASSLNNAVTSLVLNVEGIQCMRRTDRADGRSKAV